MSLESHTWDLSTLDPIPFSPQSDLEGSYENLLVYNPNGWGLENAKRKWPELEPRHKATPLVFGCSIPYEAQSNLAKWYDFVSMCYIYALGDQSLFVPRVCLSATVGATTNKKFLGPADVNENTITAFAESDGLEKTGDEIILRPDSRPVALLMAEGVDYHWLRLDRADHHSSTLLWTAKLPLEAPAIVTDGNGQPLRDPRRCLLVLLDEDKCVTYTFVSFFNVPKTLSIPVKMATRYENIEDMFILSHERPLWPINGGLPSKGIPVPQLG